MNEAVLGLILAASGAFSVICAAVDAEFFMNNRKARLPVAIMGRNGARVFYILLGAGLIVAGIGFATGLIPTHASGA